MRLIMNLDSFKLYLLLIQTVILIVGQAVNIDNCPQDLRKLCHQEQSCGECLLAHPCCNWCYDQTITDKFLCDFIDELKECGNFIQINKNQSVKVIKNQDFIDISDVKDASSVIQIKPQQFDVTLKKDQPMNISFTYKPAKNYPLELYYLGDLSYSMLTHLDTLKNLGNDLGRSLEELTKHYKLAFGSFLDKPGMPFIITAPSKIDNPCEQTDENIERCQAKTWLFKHILDFTDKMSDFFKVVDNSKISANLDDLDGALEAIFQILVCGKQFGSSENSRKIIVLSTDSLLHTAGDGMLVGATAANDELRCLMDKDGDHTDPLKYDYPSLAEIKMLLRKFKTNLIVAAPKDKINYYYRMEKDILEEEAYVGVLKENSENILELVKKGFLDFIRRVEFSVKSQIPEMQLRFFADCNGTNQYQQRAGCNNVAEEPVNFKLELSLEGRSTKTHEQIIIKEKSINEEIVINIEYVGTSCECAALPQSHLQCQHGINDCNSCTCDLGWKGTNCSEECKEDLRSCRKDGNSTCSSNGNCICGKCECWKQFTGTYCQFECPMTKTGEVCNNKGPCVEGKCACKDGYTNDDCSCSSAVDQCIWEADRKICSGHGECVCNLCSCDGKYHGNYCEIHAGQNAVCEKYDEAVLEYIHRQNSTTTKENNSVLFEDVENFEHCDNELCLVVYFEGSTHRCTVQYCYNKSTDDVIQLQIKKNCIITVQAMGFGIGTGLCTLIIFGGLTLILIKKWQIWMEEKRELKKFHLQLMGFNSQNIHETNPIYLSPFVHYKNPLHSSSAK